MYCCTVQVVAVPYATSFDHLRVSDEVHFKFERCLKALGPQVGGPLPVLCLQAQVTLSGATK
jgi:hypothetical protein